MTLPSIGDGDVGEVHARVAEALAAIRSRTTLVPRVAFTLGSGLGGAAELPLEAVRFPTHDLPHWPRSTVPGHAGVLVVGLWQGVPAVLLSGRSHRYEGYALDRVTFGVRVMRALGAENMIFTNAVGAVNRRLTPGDLMLASDHVNAIGKRGLLAPDERAARRMGRPIGPIHDPALGSALMEAALASGVPLRVGVLMGGLGPSYETAAEIEMARRMEVDAVCMSTVHEVTLAAHLGARAASLSCVTNEATGLSSRPLRHEEVTEVADRVAGRLRALLETWLRSLARG